MTYAELWLRAWIATVVIESALVHLLLVRAEPRPGRRLAMCVFVNLASHPVLWFALPEMGLRSPWNAVVMELVAIAVETAGYRLMLESLTWRRALVLSTALNLASFAGGRALRALGVWV